MDLLSLLLLLLVGTPALSARRHRREPDSPIREIALSMAPNSFDDQYQRCRLKMLRALPALNRSEFLLSSPYAEAWSKAAAQWGSRAWLGSSQDEPGSSQAWLGSSRVGLGFSRDGPGSSQAEPGSSWVGPGSSRDELGSSQAWMGSSRVRPGSSQAWSGSSWAELGSSRPEPASSQVGLGSSQVGPFSSQAWLGSSPGSSWAWLGSSPGSSQAEPGSSQAWLSSSPGSNQAWPGSSPGSSQAWLGSSLGSSPGSSRAGPSSSPGSSQAWPGSSPGSSRAKPSSPLRLEQAIALLAYTMEERLYVEFNRAVRRLGRSRREYLNNFHFKVLHFLLTEALRALRGAQSHPRCLHVFRGVDRIRFTAQPGQIVRFGQFASSSLLRNVSDFYGTTTTFEVDTCHGANIRHYSIYPEEEEVLIPPYETFNVTGVTRQGDEVLIQLRSHGVHSKYNCAWFRGRSVPRAPPGLTGLLLAALAALTGTP